MAEFDDLLQEFGFEAQTAQPVAPQDEAEGKKPKDPWSGGAEPIPFSLPSGTPSKAPSADQNVKLPQSASAAPDDALRVTVTPGPAQAAPAPDPFADLVQDFAKPPEAPSMFGGLGRGYERFKQGTAASAYMLGLGDDLSFATELLASKAAEAQYPMTEEERQGAQEFANAEGIAALTPFFTNPKFTLGQILESVPSMIGSVAGGVGGGLAGSLAGPAGAGAGAILGVGAGSGVTEYGSSFVNYLEKKIGKPLDSQNVLAALQDKDLVNEAHWYAAKRSGSVAFFDMVGAKLGGAVARRFFAPGTSVASKATGVGVGVGLEGATEAAGEAGGQLLTEGPSGMSAKEIMAEGLLGTILGGAEAFVSPAAEWAAGKVRTRAPQDEELERAFQEFTGETPTGEIPTGETPQPPVAAQPQAVPVEGEVLPPEPQPKAPNKVVEEGPAAASPQEWQSRLMAEGHISERLLERTEPRLDKAEVQRVVESEMTDLVVTPSAAPRVGLVKAAEDYTASSPSGQALVRTSLRDDNYGRELLFIDDLQPVPEMVVDGVSLPEITLRRMVDEAQERGLQVVGWNSRELQPNADPVFERAVPSVMRKIAAERGGIVEESKVRGVDGVWRNVNILRLNEASRVGVTPFLQKVLDVEDKARKLGTERIGELDEARTSPLLPHFKKFAQAASDILRQIGAPPVDFVAYADASTPDVAQNNGFYSHAGVISVNLASSHVARNAFMVWSVMAHEMGHHIMRTSLQKADDATKLAIRAAYDRWRARLDPSMRLLAEDYNPWPDAKYTEQNLGRTPGKPIRLMSQAQQAYWLGFDEWFAEQTARWATSQEKPLGVVEKFFQQMGRMIMRLFLKLQGDTGFRPEQFQAEPEVEAWLNSLVTDPPEIGAEVFAELDLRTLKANEQALKKAGDDPSAATGQTQATQPARTMLRKLFGGSIPPRLAADAAHADKFNKFYAWMLSLPQVAQKNTHIRDLQLYKEETALGMLRRQERMGVALQTLKALRAIGAQQQGRVWKVLEDLANLEYLTQQERAQGVRRQPTQQEFEAIVRKHQLGADGVRLVGRIRQDFDRMLAWYGELLSQKAEQHPDPVERGIMLQKIREQLANYRKVPYLPFMRFGDYVIVVRDPAGNVMHREHFETQRQQKRARERLARQYGVPLKQVQMSVIPKEARPFMGMPPQMLELIEKELNLSPIQKEAIQQLKFDLAPMQSFKHRFQHKTRTPGYSTDFTRAYANYFFHGATHMMRLELTEKLQGYIAAVREQANFMPDGVKRMQIANYMSDHFAEMMNPKEDFYRLRGMMFMWALAFSPAAAAINLTQLMTGTWPVMGQRFGDTKAVTAMLNAGRKLSTFYRQGTYQGQTDFELRAIGELIKEGVITEAMAPELAAISEGNTLGKGFGGNAYDRGITKFLEWGAWLFQMAEQVNRRVTARAALQLALDNPEVPWMREVAKTNIQQIQRLKLAGYSEREALAIAAAKQMVEDTQFTYQQWAQPRLFRGKMRTVLVFKSFLQNMLFLGFGRNMGITIRFLFIMGALGGLMGLPGTEDLEDLLKAAAWLVFGKHFDLQVEMRKWLTQHMEADNADLVLHGLARRGFGIPAVLDALGGVVGVDVPMPTLDRSRAIGLGNILPVEIGDLFGPSRQSPDARLGQAGQQASGAAFGTMYNILRAIADSETSATDFKRWERAVPRFIGSASKAFRAYTEGGERNRSGAMVVRYDPRDPEQMFEILAVAMGYNPLRLSKEWDRIIATREAIEYWNLRRTGLMKMAYEAQKGGDPKEIEEVTAAIQKFNSELPEAAKGKAITSESLGRSMQTRERVRRAQEAGRPLQRGDLGIYEEMDRIFKGTTTSFDPVRRPKAE